VGRNRSWGRMSACDRLASHDNGGTRWGAAGVNA
jgi:hypothetical protein